MVFMFDIACAGLLGNCKAPHVWFKFQDNCSVEGSPKSFVGIWEPAPPSRLHSLCIPGGAAPRRWFELVPTFRMYILMQSINGVVDAVAKNGKTMLRRVVV